MSESSDSLPLADLVFEPGGLQIGFVPGIGVVMVRNERCYVLRDGSWVPVPWLEDPVDSVPKVPENGVRMRLVPRLLSHTVGNRVTDTAELSDSVLVAGDFGGRFLKDLSGAWLRPLFFDSFWLVDGKITAFCMMEGKSLLGLGLTSLNPEDSSLVCLGGYEETHEPVCLRPRVGDTGNDVMFLGWTSDYRHSVHSTADFEVQVVERPTNTGRSREIVDPPDPYSVFMNDFKWFGSVSGMTRPFVGLTFFREVDGEIWVFAGQDWGCGEEIGVTQLSIIRRDYSVDDLVLTGYPSVYFGDRLVVIDGRIIAAHGRVLFELDRDRLHFEPVLEVADEIVSLLVVDEQLLAFSLVDADAIPTVSPIHLPK